MIKRLHGAGSVQVFIDDVYISGVLSEGVPIPDVDTEAAVLKYHLVPKDEGQLIIDNAVYGKNKTHEFKIILANDQTWVYDGKILSHEIYIKSVISETIYIKLNGKFKYMRNTKSEPIEIIRDLS